MTSKSLFCKASFVASATAATSVERGEYLVRGIMGCGNCHTEIGPDGPGMTKELAGGLVEKNEMFTAYVPNSTPAGEVARWFDAERAHAIREGIAPDGSLLGPPMPLAMCRSLGDDDLASIVMFLRTLPAVENEVPDSA